MNSTGVSRDGYDEKTIALAKHIIRASLFRDGITYDLLEQRDVSTEKGDNGYVVSGKEPGLAITLDNRSGGYERQWSGLWRIVAGWLTQLPVNVRFVGGWVDDSVLYLDANDIMDDEITAINVARDRGEKAIYDLATGDTIFV